MACKSDLVATCTAQQLYTDIFTVTAAAAISGIAATAAYLDAKFHIRNDLKIGDPNNAAADAFAYMAKKQAEDKMLNYHVLEWWAEQDRPNHVFLQFEGSQWTYKQFYLEVQRVGNWLMNDLGIERNEIVALDGRNSNSFMLLWYAIEAIGACPAFINSNLTSDSLVHCVKVRDIDNANGLHNSLRIADCFPASRCSLPHRRESYRATGRALSRQSRSRKRADSILRRRSCQFLP